MTEPIESGRPHDDAPTRPFGRPVDGPAEVPTAGSRSGSARRRGAIRNTALNGLSRLVSIATSFLLTPVILHVVGGDAFGLWVLIGSVVAYGSLLDLGIGGALTKYVAEHTARGEIDSARATIAAGARLYVALGVVLALIGITLAPAVPTLLGVPLGQRDAASATAAAMAIGLGIAIPCTTATAVLRGVHRYDVAAAIAVVGSLLSVGTTVLALAAGWGVLGIVVAGIPIPVLTQLLALAAIRRVAPALVGGASVRTPGVARRIVSFSWPLFLLDVAGRLQSKSDEIVVGVALSLGSVAPYALGRKLSTIPRLVAEQFAMTLLPLASELDARQERARLQRLYLSGVRVALAIATPLTGCLLFLAAPILDAWVGPGFGNGGPIVVTLAIAAWIDLSLWPAGFVLQGIAHHRWLGPISLGSGIANLALSLALARPFGILGVALGTLIPTVIEAVVILTPYTLRTLDIPARRYLVEAIAPVALASLPMLLVVGLLSSLAGSPSLPVIAVLGGLAHLLFGAAYLALPVTAPERAIVRELVRGLQTFSGGRRGRPRSPGSSGRA